VYRVPSIGEGACEAGHVTFDTADAWRAPIGDKGNREKLDDRLTPINNVSCGLDFVVPCCRGADPGGP
jgi:hypothetical protein